MAYDDNPRETEKIRERLKDILREKIQDPEYKGRALVGGSRRKSAKTEKIKRMSGSAYAGGGMSGGLRPKKKKNANRVAAGKSAARKNSWITFYRKFAKQRRLKGMSGAEIAKKASIAYRRSR